MSKYAHNHPGCLRKAAYAHWTKKWAFILWLKDQPCFDCGHRFIPCVMEFDHARGTKICNIGRLYTASLKRLQRELVKCDLVCANCHCIRAWRRRESALLDTER